MQVEIEAIYENGVLKPGTALPFSDHELVTITVRSRQTARASDEGTGQQSRIRKSAGLIPWSGSADALEYLLGPENSPWEKS
jgi:predicted DNA-binding antitoxin AbrB/MazE fold protein